jgi:hypothetical protein
MICFGMCVPSSGPIFGPLNVCCSLRALFIKLWIATNSKRGFEFSRIIYIIHPRVAACQADLRYVLSDNAAESAKQIGNFLVTVQSILYRCLQQM